MTDPANKTVLITGAGGGFGREMVRQFKDAGSKLFLTDITDDAMRDVIDTAGDSLVAAVPADLAKEAGINAVIQACNTHNTVPDILVNNAGLGTAGRLDHIPNEQW
ncbi:MAG: SDR family oxidoreductase, partial [Woeseiaceae bacterium]|nr:SDR family oxidoreductase [Woeseiaceae bacterium]